MSQDASIDSNTAIAGTVSRLALLPPFLKLEQVGAMLHLGRTAAHALVSRPDFPRPRQLGGRHRLWVTQQVLDWFDKQPLENRRSMPAALAAARRYRGGKLVS